MAINEKKILKMSELARVQQCVDSIADSMQHLSANCIALKHSLKGMLPQDPVKRKTKLHHIAYVAKQLGVSRPQIYKLVYNGEIEAIRVGTRGIRITDESVENFIEENRILPSDIYGDGA